MIEKSQFLEAMHYRHATKVFDEAKKITAEDMAFILETGRLSPSSFGVEQWHFVVITNQEVKDKIQAVSWNQPQIGTSSHLVIVLARKDVRSSDTYVQDQIARWGLPEEGYNAVMGIYHGWVDGRSDEVLELWSEKQCYIAAANMMTSAAAIGIDSCPIEGFEYAKVDEILGLDTNVYQSALVLPFGYRINDAKPKTRLALEKVVTYIE